MGHNNWLGRFLPRITAGDKEKRGGIKMKRVEVGTEAPDFVLEEVNGRSVRLSDFRNEKTVYLVLNRGFG